MIDSQEEKQIRKFYSKVTKLLLDLGFLKKVHPNWDELLEAMERMAHLTDLSPEEYHPDDVTEL